MSRAASGTEKGRRGRIIRRGRRCASWLLAAAALLSPFAQAQDAGAPPNGWAFSAALNLYVPSLSGSSRFPADSGGTPIEVSGDQILDRLKGLFMGSFEAQNGRWGIATDVIYVHFGNSVSNSRDFSIGDMGLPAGTTANLDWNFKATAWTIAGEWRIASQPSMAVDVLAGTRLLDIRQDLTWGITGNLGSLPPSSRTGTAEGNRKLWDAIVGVKSRYRFGDRGRWVVPLYADAGIGESQGTLQLAAGIGYGFGWGEVNAMYRYLHYRFKSGSPLTDLTLSGPQVGVVFRW